MGNLGKVDQEGKAEPRPGGLRSIEQAAREYVEAERNFMATLNTHQPAHVQRGADAWMNAAYERLCVAVDGWTPDSQTPTARSAPPPAGPTSPPLMEQTTPWTPAKPDCDLCCGSGFYGDNGPGRKGNREYVRCECTVPVEPPAPRPAEEEGGHTPRALRLGDKGWIACADCGLILPAKRKCRGPIKVTTREAQAGEAP